MGRVLLTILLLAVSIALYQYFKKPPALPEVDLDEWWGPKELMVKQDKSIRPFEVEFSKKMIKDLKHRLKNRRPLTPPLEGVGFEYGFNSKHLESWLDYWAEGYPFSQRQQFLNKYPQFKTNIQGLDIHFLRIKPDVSVPVGVEVVPMLFLHGWPGSVREFYEAIPHLTAVSKDSEFALEVIVPSLPGFGYSGAPVRPGLGIDKIAVVFRNLMQRLGYKKYYVQGGDWGGATTSMMVTLFPQEILGYHTNLPNVMVPMASFFRMLGAIYPPLVVSADVQDRMYPLSDMLTRMSDVSGHIHIQSTKPDTVGVGLTDSAAGFAAYFLEKFSSCTNHNYGSRPDGGLTEKYTKDQLIDNLMMYWVPNSITTANRLYSEALNKRSFGLEIDQIPSPVPTWIIQSKYEVAYTPAWMVKFKYPNLINETILHDGGHFLALEMPEVFAEDVLKAVQSFRSWHKRHDRTEL